MGRGRGAGRDTGRGRDRQGVRREVRMGRRGEKGGEGITTGREVLELETKISEGKCVLERLVGQEDSVYIWERGCSGKVEGGVQEIRRGESQGGGWGRTEEGLVV
ncbi:hypothetical protein Pcinc_040377 [Petrolisthes cinctipes]|uniref:Uncharacterized protein n=1 Tax=Petrolisthes cinctipes TaxID=88211 RepID=A0AAE1BM18_PETCI|nr:hypothetical protein Pcinc_040377 [Petrolisthes cinctipes]